MFRSESRPSPVDTCWTLCRRTSSRIHIQTPFATETCTRIELTFKSTGYYTKKYLWRLPVSMFCWRQILSNENLYLVTRYNVCFVILSHNIQYGKVKYWFSSLGIMLDCHVQMQNGNAFGHVCLCVSVCLFVL